jgi:hypothetical protein
LTTSIDVLPVQRSADMRRFIEFPYEHYRVDPNWVAPLRLDQRQILDTAKHPFYRHAEIECFLARSEDRVCGRIAAILDRDDKVGTFGFYESVDSQLVADALFQAAKEWLAARGASAMRGPMNPSILLRVWTAGGWIQFTTHGDDDL